MGAQPPTIQLIFGDNLQVLQRMLHSYADTVSLVYMDPPFFTLREHDRIVRQLQPGKPPLRQRKPAFDDRWVNFPAYLDSLRTRVKALYPLLSPHGSLVIHVDSRASHYIKVMVDEIFGIDCFASEIIWRYRRWPSKTRNFQRVHDVLLRWVRSSEHEPRFVQLYEQLAPSTVRTWGRGKQRAVIDSHGRRTRSSTQTQPSPGVAMGDVWDIAIVAPVARERTGYPTQKPEALLHRLISACSLPGDLVLDPYVGSGTTLSAAWKLERRAIGIDSSAEAIDVCRSRLSALGCSFTENLVAHTSQHPQ